MVIEVLLPGHRLEVVWEIGGRVVDFVRCAGLVRVGIVDPVGRKSTHDASLAIDVIQGRSAGRREIAS